MASLIITNIGLLAGVHKTTTLLRGKELSLLPCIKNAFLRIEDGRIAEFGESKNLKSHKDKTIDANSGMVLPAWCDSHTHLVFPASREDEFVDKIKGLSYAQIAERGGGILNSAGKLAAASEEELYSEAMEKLKELISLGTGAIEIKSGYGLSVDGELKMLRVIKKLKANVPIPVKASFLGAHTYPLAFRDNHEGYINQVIEEMLPVIAKESLADYIDVFCENGFFSVEESRRIINAGKAIGLKPKIHANQLSSSGAVELGVKLGALSVDHLETMDDNAIKALAGSTTIGTLLPTAAFFLRMPFQPARKLIDNNCAIAVASDFNPGSSPSGNMNLVVSMACIGMRMLPEEAINAATINGAFAMEVESELGSITEGKKASLIITRPVSSLAYLPYAFGTNLVNQVFINGELWEN